MKFRGSKLQDALFSEAFAEEGQGVAANLRQHLPTRPSPGARLRSRQVSATAQPPGGAEGLRNNVAEVARWREAFGPDFPLMIDRYMSLTPA